MVTKYALAVKGCVNEQLQIEHSKQKIQKILLYITNASEGSTVALMLHEKSDPILIILMFLP